MRFVSLVFAFMFLAIPVMAADCACVEADYGEIVMVAEFTDGEIATVYEDVNGKQTVVKSNSNSACSGCGTAEEKPSNPIDTFGYIIYMVDEENQAINRVRVGNYWQLHEDWSIYAQFDYRYRPGGKSFADASELFLTHHFKGGEWSFGRNLTGTGYAFPPPHVQPGPYPNMIRATGPADKTGFHGHITNNGTDYYLAVVDERDQFAGRFDDVAARVRHTFDNGVKLASSGFWADDNRNWSVDGLFPIGKSSHIKVVLAGSEKAPRSHASYWEGSWGFAKNWSWNVALDRIDPAGVPTENWVHTSFGRQFQIGTKKPTRALVGYSQNTNTNEGVIWGELQYSFNN